jgi:parvulin-like peptidyl-prolyl isomerase
LQQGQSFEALVEELKDSSSVVQGADLGLFRLHELSEQLQEVVNKMNTDEFSPVLATDFGYQIIYLQKIQETPAKPLEEVESEIQEALYNELADNKYEEWLQDLRKRSHIKIIN